MTIGYWSLVSVSETQREHFTYYGGCRGRDVEDTALARSISGQIERLIRYLLPDVSYGLCEGPAFAMQRILCWMMS